MGDVELAKDSHIPCFCKSRTQQPVDGSASGQNRSSPHDSESRVRILEFRSNCSVGSAQHMSEDDSFYSEDSTDSDREQQQSMREKKRKISATTRPVASSRPPRNANAHSAAATRAGFQTSPLAHEAVAPRAVPHHVIPQVVAPQVVAPPVAPAAANQVNARWPALAQATHYELTPGLRRQCEDSGSDEPFRNAFGEYPKKGTLLGALDLPEPKCCKTCHQERPENISARGESDHFIWFLKTQLVCQHGTKTVQSNVNARFTIATSLLQMAMRLKCQNGSTEKNILTELPRIESTNGFAKQK